MITNSGIIEDYTSDGEKNRTFPQLPSSQISDDFPGKQGFYSIHYNIFGVYHNNGLHFLTCDPSTSVKIYHIDNHRMENVPDSKIPHLHLLNVKGKTIHNRFAEKIHPDGKGWFTNYICIFR